MVSAARRRGARGFFTTDAIVGLILVAALAAALAVAAGRQRRAVTRLADSREAIHLAERAMTSRQIGKSIPTTGADERVADRVLGTAHTPDEGAGSVFRHQLGGGSDFVRFRAGDAFGFFRRPLGDFFTDLIHAVDALLDISFIVPVVFEDMPQHTPDDRHVAARADAQILIGMRRGAGETRIDDQ